MYSSVIRNFDDFIQVHGFLLASSGIPPSLYHQLFLKLSSETFDGGDYFKIEPCEEGRQRRLIISSESMEKESQLFLIDHAWTFRLSHARKQLLEVPGLAQRMAALMCVDLDLGSVSEETEFEPKEPHENSTKRSASEILERELHIAQEKGRDAPTWLELEELDIDDEMLTSLDLSSKFPNLVALNLWGNKLQNLETVVREVTRCRNLKAVWLNANPIIQSCHIADTLEVVPGLEIFNSCFTSNFNKWALGFCGGIYGMDNPCGSRYTTHPLTDVTTLDLSNRGIRTLSNKAFSPIEMPSLSYLNLRGNPLDRTSVDDLLKILQGFSCLQALEVDIPGPVGESALKVLESLPSLSLLNGVRASSILESGKHIIYSKLQPRLPEWTSDEPLAERVIGAMWLYLMTYRLADEEKLDETSVWYVMDELGSALRHNDVPNFRVAPFLFMPEGKLTSAVSFSVLWPTQNVQKGEECTRDFLFGIGEDKQRSARLTAWFHTLQNYFILEYEKYSRQLQSKSFCPPVWASVIQNLLPSDGRALLVHTDLPQVEEFLARPEFILTSDPKDADIIWTCMQVDEEMKKATGLTDQQYINQFPFEACLVMKHHLAETVYEAQGFPEWFQPTYNLETQLSELIGDYSMRQGDGRNNLWILKPWNMARTIDTTVTGDLSAIIRLMETGPKICQKYIDHPALFQGKKFDLRYIVLVRSMNPLEIFLSDVFWVRLANNAYSLDISTLFDYETHFTVMNYIGRMNHMYTPDFVTEFEKEHQGLVNWMDIHQRIRNMIRTVFESAAMVHPEMHSSMSRAMYGVDVMLDSSFQPKLLEVTYCPDCTRACKYDTKAVAGNGGVVKAKDFFNDVFGCLFLNESTNVTGL
ncbi:tubulin-tyrosine ligase isoform X3 [Tasmannia lanceolata]|uniref:tubulin-tyrosine ligase isoform X3 n=1 Tax=Tasmannia lanceolata TaxID=3420 RepID=UPI00406445F2